MLPKRFVRITLESFFHCGDTSSFSNYLQVSACDFPVEYASELTLTPTLTPTPTLTLPQP